MRPAAAVFAMLAAGALSNTPPVTAWPVENGRILETFRGKHQGIDIAAQPGTPVLAYAAGVIEAQATDKTGNRYLRVRHAGADSTSLYFNLADVRVSVGDIVNAGTPLAVVAIAPAGRKAHLHFEVVLGGAKVDPLAHLPRTSS
jgi:murein DD-endopeptidase MepM/ murein hydrolase activator NlpD